MSSSYSSQFKQDGVKLAVANQTNLLPKQQEI
jgi:hypothetical protein